MTPLTSCDLCLAYRPENILKKGKTNQFHLQDVFLSAKFQNERYSFFTAETFEWYWKTKLGDPKIFSEKRPKFHEKPSRRSENFKRRLTDNPLVLPKMKNKSN